VHLELAQALTRLGQRDRNSALTAVGGMAAYFSGDGARAKRMLGAAVRGDPQDVGARLYRALLTARETALPRAAADLAAALRADTRQPVARLYQARLLLERHKAPLARSIFEDLVAQNPLDLGARSGLAAALAEGGDRKAALEEAARVLSVRPEHGETLALLLRLERGVVSSRR